MATVLQRHDPSSYCASMYSIFQRGRTDPHDQVAPSTSESRQYVEKETPVFQDEKDVSMSPASSRGQPTTPSRRKRRKISGQLDPHTAPPSIAPVLDAASSTFSEKSTLTPVTVVHSDSTHTDNAIGPVQGSASPQTAKMVAGKPANGGSSVVPRETDPKREYRWPHAEPSSQETTRKKTLILKLGKNGKLNDPSPTPTRTSPRTRPSISTRPTQPPAELKSKNLKVRNGKLTQSLVVRISYRDRGADPQWLSDKIADILSRPPGHKKTTHPFFTARLKQPTQDHPLPNDGAEYSDDPKINTKVERANTKPIAWSDIVFKSKRPNVSTALQPQRPIWPPLELQHIGVERGTQSFRPVKATEKRTIRPRSAQLDCGDPVTAIPLLPDRLSTLQHRAQAAWPCKINFVPGIQIATRLDSARLTELSPASLRVRDHVLQGASPFDRAEAAGPLMWTQQYAPTCWEEVLQPAARMLHDWLKTLAVHNVKQGLDNPLLKHMHKSKKRGRKPKDELDDFIVDDDDVAPSKAPKNAILLVGPNGCGKTAAVFATARQLNFEVFEIHAGEHRSQKDIFDRVGNMTQNHLVRTGQQDSRGSSLAPDDHEIMQRHQEDRQQTTTPKFFSPLQSCPTKIESRPSTPQPGRREQKQSLILLEEVDNVFDEDKSFWTGVQSLIQKSKRPVVMTCNDISNIPLDEIELHQILYCVPPATDTAVDYLTYVAAAEGHILHPLALRRLYLSTGRDIRASLTQLNFWCQMTVGSKRGGLDWYLSQPKSVQEGSAPRHRVFSEDTYRTDLDTIPEHASDLETTLLFGQLCLDVEPKSLDISLNHQSATLTRTISSVLERSDGDLLDASTQPLFYSMLFSPLDCCAVRDAISSYRIRNREQLDDVRATVSTAFEPLLDEPSVFPPSQGRLAPSIDCSRNSVMTDIAPYVRTIVAFDQRLEQQREELFSSQGKKSRNTRAARAAAEGGDKATSRRDRWFGKDLDMNAVMATGGAWPQWSGYDSEEAEQVFDGQGLIPESSSP